MLYFVLSPKRKYLTFLKCKYSCFIIQMHPVTSFIILRNIKHHLNQLSIPENNKLVLEDGNQGKGG